MNFVVLVLALVVQGQADVDLGDSGFVRWEGAGFGAMEPGTVRFNERLPRENNVQPDEPYPIPESQLTDGRGLVIRCKPGQGVVLYGQTIRSFWPVLVRIAGQAHSRSGRFTISLGAVGPFGHVVAEQRNGLEYFTRGWRTRSVVYNLAENDRLYYTAETQVTPILQVVSTDTVYETLLFVDGLQVEVMRPAQWWGFDVFRSIKYPVETLYLEANQTVTPTPRPTPTVTPTPWMFRDAAETER